MMLYTPIQDRERVTAAAFNSRLTELATAIGQRANGFAKVTNWISLSGLTTYNISDIPTNLTLLQLRVFARVAISGSDPRITFNNDSTTSYRNNSFGDGAANGLGATQSIPLQFSITTHNASEFGVSDFSIYNYLNTPQFVIAKYLAANTNVNHGNGIAKHDNIAPITSIQIFSGTPAFELGSMFRLYALGA